MMIKLPGAFCDHILFAEAWLSLACARLLLLIIPFKQIVPLLGKITDRNSHIVLHSYNYDVQQKIRTAILRSSRYSPWQTKCFEQALTAKMMLKRRGLKSVVYFGIYKPHNNKKLFAHAWLISNSIVVTGGSNLSQYKILITFEG